MQKSTKKMAMDPGITMLQINLLDHIKDNPGIQFRDLCENFLLSPSSVSQLLDRLYEQGFIDREINPDDRRFMLISLTKKGEKTIEKLKKERLKMMSGIAKFMSAGDIEKMIEIHKNVLGRIERVI
ncbi:MAG: MarR family transcriptional regulator [Candidatus Moranbacteria bacterium]|nr:MarR family transcriptional regulator [Candidatus Moranbacteria bacterium]